MNCSDYKLNVIYMNIEIKIRNLFNKLFNKLLNILNIHADDNQKWLLWSMFISGLLGTYVSPVIMKAVISELPAEWIAFEAVFSSSVALFIGMIWKGKFRQNIIHYFIIFCICECLAGFLTAMYLVFINYNVWVLAITQLIYSNFICSLVGKCIMAFKTKLWPENEREIYDNNISIVGGITCIAGFGVALLMMPSLSVGLFIWGLCCIIDDFGWIIVYRKNKEILRKIV